MKVKCEYCGAMIEDSASFCPNCGAPNQNMKRTAEHTPKTIEELKSWYAARHLPPPEVTRFFIGVDYKEPRAFGIYKVGNECIVYKNKDDGSRAIRYRGDDEAYAVNELYLKLKSEILNQKALNQKKGRGGRGGSSSGCGGSFLKWIATIIAIFLIYTAATFNPLLTIILTAAPFAAFFLIRFLLAKKGKDVGSFGKYWIFFVIYLLIMSFVVVGVSPSKSRASYYSYNDQVYAQYNNHYYVYDPVLYDYTPIDWYYVPDALVDRPEDYEFDAQGIEWDNSYKFEDSDYYEKTIAPEERSSYSNDNNSWDNDSDWDWDSGDSWDSGGSDWGSDW